MIKACHRITAFILSLVLVFSLWAALPKAQAAGNAQPTSYSKTSNSGTRDVVCTSLSGTGADKYYTGSYTYDTLSAKAPAALLTSLRSLMSSGHSSSSYADCKNYAYKTDCENGDGRVSLLYCGYSATQGQFSGSAPGWNREHVWPKSLGGFQESGAGADLHHIRPDDVTTNGQRGNKLYGNVTNGTASRATITGANNALGGYYNSNYFEPLDNVKGDVARICLYVYARYGAQYTQCSNITNVFQSVDVLLDWCESDPVDTWEMGRNVVVQNLQGNRNVFIDYPEFAWLLFNKEIPADMTTPSGEAEDTEVTYDLGVSVNNGNYGRASISGNVITAKPNEGYEVVGYTMSPEGAATVIRNGNVFTVTNQVRNCIITINFAEKAKTTLYYIVPPFVTAAASDTAYVGESVTLPSVSGVPDGFTFYCWAVDPEEYSTTAPNGYKAGAAFTANEETTFQAVFNFYQAGIQHYTTLPEVAFDDVPETGWYTAASDFVVWRKLMQGTAVGKFSPNVTTNRAMFVTLLWNFAGKPDEGENTFSDVADGLWYTDAIAWASHNGIVNGVGADKFNPNGTMTREQMTTLLYRYSQLTGEDVTNSVPCTDFADGTKVSGWANDAMCWAVAEGLVGGSTVNGVAYLNPQGVATRAQLAVIFQRYILNIENQ